MQVLSRHIPLKGSAFTKTFPKVLLAVSIILCTNFHDPMISFIVFFALTFYLCCSVSASSYISAQKQIRLNKQILIPVVMPDAFAAICCNSDFSPLYIKTYEELILQVKAMSQLLNRVTLGLC